MPFDYKRLYLQISSATSSLNTILLAVRRLGTIAYSSAGEQMHRICRIRMMRPQPHSLRIHKFSDFAQVQTCTAVLMTGHTAAATCSQLQAQLTMVVSDGFRLSQCPRHSRYQDSIGPLVLKGHYHVFHFNILRPAGLVPCLRPAISPLSQFPSF